VTEYERSRAIPGSYINMRPSKPPKWRLEVQEPSQWCSVCGHRFDGKEQGLPLPLRLFGGSALCLPCVADMRGATDPAAPPAE